MPPRGFSINSASTRMNKHKVSHGCAGLNRFFYEVYHNTIKDEIKREKCQVFEHPREVKHSVADPTTLTILRPYLNNILHLSSNYCY